MTDFSDARLRVRYAETDQMGVVYYANYLVWFEVGRAEFCRRCGFSYEEMERSAGCYLVVAEASCRYLSPLRYDQEFLVRTRLTELRSRILSFGYELRHPTEERVFARGMTRHVPTGLDGRPRTLPEEYRKLLSEMFSLG